MQDQIEITKKVYFFILPLSVLISTQWKRHSATMEERLRTDLLRAKKALQEAQGRNSHLEAHVSSLTAEREQAQIMSVEYEKRTGHLERLMAAIKAKVQTQEDFNRLTSICQNAALASQLNEAIAREPGFVSEMKRLQEALERIEIEKQRLMTEKVFYHSFDLRQMIVFLSRIKPCESLKCMTKERQWIWSSNSPISRRRIRKITWA